MMKELKYILVEVLLTWWEQIKSIFLGMSKLKELVPLFFTLSILFFIFQNYTKALYALMLYLFFFLWKIIEQGDWRFKMRTDIKEGDNDEHSKN
jgi:ABC-type transport system involved in Fe-S cluster assembly fused permease/ATPase subunit